MAITIVQKIRKSFEKATKNIPKEVMATEKFYLTFRKGRRKTANNNFGMVFFDDWKKIIIYIHEMKLRDDQIAYYGAVEDNTETNFDSWGELWQIKALV